MSTRSNVGGRTMLTETQDTIRPHLRPGEKLLWSGRPDPTELAMMDVVYLIVAGGAAGIGAVLLSGDLGHSLLSDQSPDAAGVRWILGFGALVWASVSIATAWRIAACWRCYYALTDDRALIVVDLWPRSVKSYGYSAFHSMERTGDDVRGTIVFGEPEEQNFAFRLGSDSRNWRPKGRRPRFAGIEQPAKVEDIIRKRLAAGFS